MAKVSTNISIDADVKKRATALLAEFGMDLSTAVNIFLKQMLAENRIPFEIKRKIPNVETISAINEGRKIASDTSIEGYNSIEDFKKAIDA